ncbi:HD domain-containing protein [Anoxybacillus sp. LAT_35]|uniref:HD-GYP domain-containing protein n=1 Tax=Anoxybacillus TaxID=150247 RepID=UPI001EDA2CA9|nr:MULTISPECIES: HD domain-containing phosphohydrolase [Anoxybacillus]MCG5024955.1 HD domain-containing protein [Anoxybacillus flavithermus]MCG6198634.1 HD domain-containing protein [Anoxybacillus sp. LAT_38]MCG3085151.1 HD domain-containing protein [Anoxybacillus sp. LAT27]MCG6173248.1 HD domain-containing protein [Anoxybacillus sp. LAT_11]MCG6175085.1 HD domain-containing protein [Anoxybacillus sp. LAT_31]
MFQRKQTYELVPGDILLHPLYRPDGLLFIQKHKKLSESVIQHIKKHYPHYFPFLVVSSEQQLAEFMLAREHASRAFIEAMKQLIDVHKQFIQFPITAAMYDVEIADETDVQPIFLSELNIFAPTWGLIEKTLDSTRLLRRAKEIDGRLNLIISKDKEILNLYEKIKRYHDVLAIHSINTTSIALMIGLTLELRDEDLLNLCLATLFADIGFTEVPKEQFVTYLNNEKADKELVHSHLKRSIELISTSTYCRQKEIIYGILDHHEHFDGVYSPNKKSGEAIHLYGRIIAIAQYYDELVGGYIGKKSYTSFKALEAVWNERGKKLDPHILRIFLDKTTLYKVGQAIQIRPYEWATIIGFTDYIHAPLRPIVQKHDGTVIDFSRKR